MIQGKRHYKCYLQCHCITEKGLHDSHNKRKCITVGILMTYHSTTMLRGGMVVGWIALFEPSLKGTISAV